MTNDKDAKANISANLQRLLAEKGMSQRALARATDDPIMTVNDAVRGHSLPNSAVLARMAEALDVSVDSLLSPPVKRNSRKTA